MLIPTLKYINLKYKDDTLKYFILILLSFTHLFAIVDLNNASPSELLELNGIGKSKAQKIINYREFNECFKSIDELSRVDGISELIVSKNRSILILGTCVKAIPEKISISTSIKNVVLEPINIIFVIIIFILAFLDLKTKKDLKSQIVSVGVLGTFVGIFIGLQGFNPDDIVNSVNEILEGLKTAFFTSIVGMSVATTLSIIEKLKDDSEEFANTTQLVDKSMEIISNILQQGMVGKSLDLISFLFRTHVMTHFDSFADATRNNTNEPKVTKRRFMESTEK